MKLTWSCLAHGQSMKAEGEFACECVKVRWCQTLKKCRKTVRRRLGASEHGAGECALALYSKVLQWTPLLWATFAFHRNSPSSREKLADAHKRSSRHTLSHIYRSINHTRKRCYATSNKQPKKKNTTIAAFSPLLSACSCPPGLPSPSPWIRRLRASVCLSSPRFPFILNSVSYLKGSPLNSAWLQKKTQQKNKQTHTHG